MWRAHRSDDVGLMAGSCRFIVFSNWVLLTPAFVLQPLTGAILVYASGYDTFGGWVGIAVGIFAIVLGL